MSRTENFNSKHHVNNNIESISTKLVKSIQEKPNSHSATDQYALDVTEETTSSTHSFQEKPNSNSATDQYALDVTEETTSSTHSFQEKPNSNSATNQYALDVTEETTSSTHSLQEKPNSHSATNQYALDVTEETTSSTNSYTQSNDTRSSASKTRSPTNTSNNVQNTQPNSMEHNQVRPSWYRIVSVDANAAESNESFSSPQPQKIQRTTNGRRNTAGITNSQSDVEWYRRVNRDVIESQKSVLSSPSESLEHRSENQHPTPPSSSLQAHSNDSDSESSVNNIHRSDSQTEPIASNTPSNESASYQSDNVIPSAIHSQLQNLNSNQSPSVSTISNPESSAVQDMISVHSSSVTRYSNRAQVLIDLDDISTTTAPRPTSSTVINGPETLEIIIRSRNNADYKFVITNPSIIRMHKILQRRILNSSNASNSTMFQQVDHYMGVLRSTILTVDPNSSIISALMSASVPRSLTIDQSSYPLLEDASEMPPVIIIDRIQNGCIIKELANCVICLEDNIGNVLLEPCNHYNMCGTCMERLTTWLCPICRSHITKITVYV